MNLNYKSRYLWLSLINY